MANLQRPFKVESILKKYALSADDRMEFLAFATSTETTNKEIQEWIKERTGESVAISSIRAWKQARVPSQICVQQISEMAAEMQGLNINSVLNYFVGTQAQFLGLLMDRALKVQLDELTDKDVLEFLPMLVREFRETAKTSAMLSHEVETIELEMSGACRMLEILSEMSGTSSDQLKIAGLAALKQIESEVRADCPKI